MEGIKHLSLASPAAYGAHDAGVYGLERMVTLRIFTWEPILYNRGKDEPFASQAAFLKESKEVVWIHQRSYRAYNSPLR